MIVYKYLFTWHVADFFVVGIFERAIYCGAAGVYFHAFFISDGLLVWRKALDSRKVR